MLVEVVALLLVEVVGLLLVEVVALLLVEVVALLAGGGGALLAGGGGSTACLLVEVVALLNAHFSLYSPHYCMQTHVPFSQSTINLDNFFVLPILHLKLKLKLAICNTFTSPRQFFNETKRRKLLTPQDDSTKLTETSE